jgi:hypothetical protein
MPDGTNFQMAAFAYGNNEEYLVHIIANLCIIQQKGMESDVKKAFQALAEVRREMKPLFEFPEDETEAEKEIQKQLLSKSSCFLNTKKSSRPRRVSQLLKPRRLMKCSVVLLTAIRKLSGTGFSTRCIPRTPGLA